MPKRKVKVEKCPLCEGKLIKTDGRNLKDVTVTFCCCKKVHKSCMEDWMEDKLECPLCGKSLDDVVTPYLDKKIIEL